jgi:hypothetical protein
MEEEKYHQKYLPHSRLFKPSTVDEIFRVFFQHPNSADRGKKVGVGSKKKSKVCAGIK